MPFYLTSSLLFAVSDVKFVVIWVPSSYVTSNLYLTSIKLSTLCRILCLSPDSVPSRGGGRTSSNRLGTDVLKWGNPTHFFPSMGRNETEIDGNKTYQKSSKYIFYQNIYFKWRAYIALRYSPEVLSRYYRGKVLMLHIYSRYYCWSVFWPIPFVHSFIHSFARPSD